MKINNNNAMYNLLLMHNKAKFAAKELTTSQSQTTPSSAKTQDQLERVASPKFGGSERRKNSDGSDVISNVSSNAHLYHVTDLKTGYDWIDSFTFKRNHDGPLTEGEQYRMNEIKIALAMQQKQIDAQHENNPASVWSRVDPNRYLDEEGYLKDGDLSGIALRRANREALNSSINQLLSDNGITLSDKDELKFTVDAYYQVSVSGNICDEKRDSIAKVLNDNHLGKKIASTTYSVSYKSHRFSQVEEDKNMVNKELQRYTDMDLRDFKSNGKTLVSKQDGRTIQEIFSDAVETNDAIASVSKGHVKKMLDYYLGNVMKYGYDNVKDIEFEIGFVGGKLYDYNAVYGYGVGQTDWYDNLMNAKGNYEEVWRLSAELYGEYDKYSSANQYTRIIG